MARTIRPARAHWPTISTASTNRGHVWLIYGAMRDKAVEEIAAILFPRAGHVIVTAPAQARALRPESIRDLADHDSMSVAPDIQAALAMAGAMAGGAAEEDAIFVTGSLFLVGEARALLLREP